MARAPRHRQEPAGVGDRRGTGVGLARRARVGLGVRLGLRVGRGATSADLSLRSRCCLAIAPNARESCGLYVVGGLGVGVT